MFDAVRNIQLMQYRIFYLMSYNTTHQKGIEN